MLINYLSKGTIEQVWIGLKENNSDGNWKWADGTAVNQAIGKQHLNLPTIYNNIIYDIFVSRDIFAIYFL